MHLTYYVHPNGHPEHCHGVMMAPITGLVSGHNIPARGVDLHSDTRIVEIQPMTNEEVAMLGAAPMPFWATSSNWTGERVIASCGCGLIRTVSYRYAHNENPHRFERD